MRHYFKILCVLAAWLPPAMEVSSRNLSNAFLCVYRVAHLHANLGWVDLDLESSLGCGPLL